MTSPARYQDLVERYGEVMSLRDLATVLAYPTAEALRKAISRGSLSIPAFRLPHRRGWFVLTRDVAGWLSQLTRQPIHGQDAVPVAGELDQERR
jgi:hypothetical protein